MKVINQVICLFLIFLDEHKIYFHEKNDICNFKL